MIPALEIDTVFVQCNLISSILCYCHDVSFSCYVFFNFKVSSNKVIKNKLKAKISQYMLSLKFRDPGLH